MTEPENEVTRELASLTKAIGDLATRRDAAAPADGGRTAAADDGIGELARRLTALESTNETAVEADAKKAEQARINDIVEDRVKSALKGIRAPSYADSIGQGKPISGQQGRMIAMGEISASPVLKGIFADYQGGELFLAMLNRKAIGAQGLDPELVAAGKAALDDLGVQWAGQPDKAVLGTTLTEGRVGDDPSGGWAKATTGVTGATGGYVLPNNLVDTLVKPATQRAVYQTMVTVRNGVSVRGVDQPFRLGAPARMAFQDWNTLKENVNETYGSYTALLGTMARIMDITKQYARFSAGAAEADVIDELTRAAILGENYYIMAGAGTGSQGVGDPTTGIYTALAAVGQVAYRNTFSPVATTLAGSAASGFTSTLSALAARSREATGLVVDATTYWTIVGQGTDTAGFWSNPEGGPTGFSRLTSGGIAYWGIPLYYDANLSTNTTTKIVIGGEWAVAKLYRGQEFRIDTSDQAGTRWDYNLIGFRGEQEIGFHAGTAVGVGAFQLTTAIIA